MPENIDLTRRMFLLFAGIALPLAMPVSSLAGDDEGDSDNSGSENSGDDDDDSDDDNEDDEDDEDEGSDDSSGTSGSGHDDNDHDDARDAVRKGKAISLSKALSILKKSEPGRVLEVKLVKRSSGFDYRFKVLASNGKVKAISMDAATGRIRGFLGL